MQKSLRNCFCFGQYEGYFPLDGVTNIEVKTRNNELHMIKSNKDRKIILKVIKEFMFNVIVKFLYFYFQVSINILTLFNVNFLDAQSTTYRYLGYKFQKSNESMHNILYIYSTINSIRRLGIDFQGTCLKALFHSLQNQVTSLLRVLSSH